MPTHITTQDQAPGTPNDIDVPTYLAALPLVLGALVQQQRILGAQNFGPTVNNAHTMAVMAAARAKRFLESGAAKEVGETVVKILTTPPVSSPEDSVRNRTPTPAGATAVVMPDEVDLEAIAKQVEAAVTGGPPSAEFEADMQTKAEETAKRVEPVRKSLGAQAAERAAKIEATKASKASKSGPAPA